MATGRVWHYCRKINKNLKCLCPPPYALLSYRSHAIASHWWNLNQFQNLGVKGVLEVFFLAFSSMGSIATQERTQGIEMSAEYKQTIFSEVPKQKLHWAVCLHVTIRETFKAYKYFRNASVVKNHFYLLAQHLFILSL